MQEKGTAQQRYRSLVLSALYIEARRRGIPASCLPPDVLSGLGVAVGKANDPRFKLAAGTRCSTFDVSVPDDLGAPKTEKKMAELERRLKDNQALLSLPPGKATKKARKRRDVEIVPDDEASPAGSVEDLPERI